MEKFELLQLFQPVIFKMFKLQNCFVISRNTRVHLPEETPITQILIQLAQPGWGTMHGVRQLNEFFVYGCFIIRISKK